MDRIIKRFGKDNPNWKGDKVGYIALHNWVRRHKPKPDLCVRCNKKTARDLANISGKYKRDFNDYEWLCRKCHMDGDRRNFKRDFKGKFSKEGNWKEMKDLKDKRKKEILKIVKNPSATCYPELILRTKIPINTLREYLNQLTEEGKIEKIKTSSKGVLFK